MENASKALIIAGEVLIGLIVLSIFAYAFVRVSEFSQSYQDNVEQQRVIAFNSQYTKYITETGKYIYAEDVVTLTDNVLNWNQTTAVESYQITIYIYSNTSTTLYSNANGDLSKIYKASSTTGMDEADFRIEFMETYKITDDAKSEEAKFTCSMDTTGENGRVSTIYITQV